MAQEKKAEEKKANRQRQRLKKLPAISAFDTEKNYMIVVTKEGKLVTLDFNVKTKARKSKKRKLRWADVRLGPLAVVEYTTKGEKNFLSKMEFTPAKGE